MASPEKLLVVADRPFRTPSLFGELPDAKMMSTSQAGPRPDVRARGKVCETAHRIRRRSAPAGRGNRARAPYRSCHRRLLLAGTIAGPAFALSLFDAKADFVKLSSGLVVDLERRMRGLGQFPRSQRLAAAHSVIVIAAFYDAVQSTSLPASFLADIQLTQADQVRLATTTLASLASVSEQLLTSEVPAPSADQSYEAHLRDLGKYYAGWPMGC